MSKTIALFEDGTGTPVIMEKTCPDEHRDLTLVQVGIGNSQVRTSAEKAIRSSYKILKDKKRIKNGACGFSYEFEGNSHIIHESASLAFALKLVQKIEDIPFPIAATGIISASTPDSRIQKVDSINEKIDGAVKLSEPVKAVFYPNENDSELREDIKQSAKDTQLELIPVTTMEDAVEKLLDLNNRFREKTIPQVWKPWQILAQTKIFPSRSRFSAWMLILCLIALMSIMIKNDTISLISSNSDTKTIISNPVVIPTPATNTVVKPTPPQLIRIKVSLTGENTEAVSAITASICSKFKKYNMTCNNQKFNGILKGNIRLQTSEKSYQPHITTLQTELILENMEYESTNGDIVKIIDAPISGFIENSMNEAAEKLVNQIDMKKGGEEIRNLFKQ